MVELIPRHQNGDASEPETGVVICTPRNTSGVSITEVEVGKEDASNAEGREYTGKTWLDENSNDCVSWAPTIHGSTVADLWPHDAQKTPSKES